MSNPDVFAAFMMGLMTIVAIAGLIVFLIGKNTYNERMKSLGRLLLIIAFICFCVAGGGVAIIEDTGLAPN